jgi:trk system potassium uptake protein TrkH
VIYGASLVSLTMVLLASGLDPITAFTAVIASVNGGRALFDLQTCGYYAHMLAVLCAISVATARAQPVLFLAMPSMGAFAHQLTN